VYVNVTKLKKRVAAVADTSWRARRSHTIQCAIWTVKNQDEKDFVTRSDEV